MTKRGHYVVDVIDLYRKFDQTRIPSLTLSDIEINHLYERGLASIALHILQSNACGASDKSLEFLKSADLTARVIHAQQRRMTSEILDIASRHDIPVVLLKGISIADDFYAEPHHRMMADVDVLAPPDKAELLYQLLIDIGYRSPEGPQKPVLLDGHHHLPELRQPGTNISVEVHTSLFSSTALADEPLFQVSKLWTQIEPVDFHGNNCLKFCPEFQLLYTVAHWAIDQKWDINIISINDVVLMLQESSRPMNWSLIDAWLTESPLLADHLSVILLFLRNARMIEIPGKLSKKVENSERRIGIFNMKILHWLILTYPLSDQNKTRSNITQLVVRGVWQTMLQPRHRSLRPIFSIGRIFFRRTAGKSLIGSLIGRVQTFIKLIG